MKKIKAIFIIALAAIMIFGLVACAPEGTGVAVESVSISKTTLSMKMGDAAETLTATVLPENADNKNITWSVAPAGVVTVNNGKVTPVGTGTATITVITEDGEKTATCEVNVSPKAVNSIAFSKPSVSFILGISEATTVTATVSPADATNKNITYTIDDENIATVGATTGTITPIAAGNATVTATSEDGNKTATLTVSVYEDSDSAIAINNVADWELVAAKPNGKFYLTGDIDFEEGIVGKEKMESFSGTFDGRGYSLKNFRIDSTAFWDEGFFGDLTNTGVIKNTGFENGWIAGEGRTGTIVGKNGGLIENCFVDDITIISNNDYYDPWCSGGGIISDLEGGGIIQNCVVKSITSTKTGPDTSSYPLAVATRAGGLAENVFICVDNLVNKTAFVHSGTDNSGTITNCHLITTVDGKLITNQTAGAEANFSSLPDDAWDKTELWPKLRKISA